jgi:hypothetical protein
MEGPAYEPFRRAPAILTIPLLLGGLQKSIDILLKPLRRYRSSDSYIRLVNYGR